MARLRETYNKEVVPKLQEQFKYRNVNQVPRLSKIVVNMGVGETTTNSRVIDSAVDDVMRITGQKPIVIRAKKAIANFKLRENLPIGVKVTLRRDRMFEFMDRLITVALPRLRDFRGIPSRSFDGRGNYSLGLAEQNIFPEIDIDKTEVRGMDITFVTTAKTNEEGEALLRHFGFPFRESKKND